RLDSAVADLTDMWDFPGPGLTLTTDLSGLVPTWGDGVSTFATGPKILTGIWYFIGFTTDQNHVTIYVKPLGGGFLRATAALTNTATNTSYSIGGGGVASGNSNPIGVFAEARLWNGIVLGVTDFEFESRQLTPYRQDVWYWWPLLNSSDVRDRRRGNILTKIATATQANAGGAPPPLPAYYEARQWYFGAAAAAAAATVLVRPD